MWTQWLNICYNSAKNAGNINHPSFNFPYGRRKKKYAEGSQEPFGQIPIFLFAGENFFLLWRWILPRNFALSIMKLFSPTSLYLQRIQIFKSVFAYKF